MLQPLLLGVKIWFIWSELSGEIVSVEFASQCGAKWLQEHALPLWLEVGFDSDTGLFEESLNFDSSPVRPGFTRLRVQARQIFSISASSLAGLAPIGGLERAGRALHTVQQNAWANGFASRLTPQGEIAEPFFDAYDNAFMLLAFAWWYQATGEVEAIRWADKVLQAFDARLFSENGGYLESDPPVLPRRQNPHMHLLESLLALYSATNNDRYFAQATKIVDLANSKFIKNNILFEFFDSNWQVEPDQMVEPGHHAEWVFLLDQYARLGGTVPEGVEEALFRFTANEGKVAHLPFLYGGVHLQPPHRPDPVSRLWVQTEALRAYGIMAKHTQAEALVTDQAALEQALFDTYLNTEIPGLWNDVYDWSNGEMVAKDVPASSLYHLITGFMG